MEKEKLEALLIDYIDGVLSADDVKIAERELAQNEMARQLYAQLIVVLGAFKKSPSQEPSWSLKQKFDQILQVEIGKASIVSPVQRQIFLTPFFLRIAAALVLLLITAAGVFWTLKNQQQQEEVAALRREMDATRRLMMTMLDNQQSASTRMKGATVAYNLEKADDQLVNVLVRTMSTDPNTNVRLAALEALGKFHQQPGVRRALIASLMTQKDPLVQIALIQLMVQMNERGAIRELENITNDVQTMKAVKDEAYSGLMKLS